MGLQQRSSPDQSYDLHVEDDSGSNLNHAVEVYGRDIEDVTL